MNKKTFINFICSKLLDLEFINVHKDNPKSFTKENCLLGVLARTPRKVQQGIFKKILKTLLLDYANIIGCDLVEIGVRKTPLKMRFVCLGKPMLLRCQFWGTVISCLCTLKNPLLMIDFWRTFTSLPVLLNVHEITQTSLFGYFCGQTEQFNPGISISYTTGIDSSIFLVITLPIL